MLPVVGSFHVETNKAVTAYKLWLCPNTLLCMSLFCVQVHMTTKLMAPTTVLHTKKQFCYQRCLIIEVQTKLQLMRSCHPKHPSTYCGVFASTVYIMCRLIWFWMWDARLLYTIVIYTSVFKTLETRGKIFFLNCCGCRAGKCRSKEVYLE